ncbi:SIMPL domain-containing protein [Pseudoalteromonas phenolica]|uniref:SIMPL domain-containing protein n=1 Tax=Pseudoalteromonas phenolica TaxID=161398 RepID=UPI0013EE906C|nr:SIMPL domain-containing protein [Pseudoalteromonas phenolica]
MRILILICSLVLSATVTSSPIPDFPFITVTGESSRKVAPDTAVINLEAIAFSKNSTEAFGDLNKATSNIITVLKNYKVTTDKITTHQLRKDTKRAREKNGYNQLDILGYELTQVFEIRLDSIENYTAIADELSKMDNVKNIRSEFDVTNREDIEIELIGLAGENAKMKAKKMALGLGVKIDTVFAINDSGSYKSFFATFGLDSERAISFGMPPVENSFFVPKHIKISKNINVLYKLKN